VFRVTGYTMEDVAAWQHPSRRQAAWTDAQQRMARLEPLDPPPPPHPISDRVIARLTRPYPHEPYTRLPAALAATADSKAVRPGGSRTPADSTSLAPPPLFGADRAPAPDEIGSATHRVLQHLDFTQPCNTPDVCAQVAEMVDGRFLDERQARAVDADAIAWLMSSDLGALLRQNAKTLRREVPIYAPVPGPADAAAPALDSTDPLDRVMLRGRLDVLLPLGDRCVVVDYKTDAVSADQVADRLALHRPQLAAYARAVEAMTGKPARTLAVFLRPRVICEV
jgi:ATP-dependent helicase/nuclease subunit A